VVNGQKENVGKIHELVIREKEQVMNWDQIAGNWKQVKGAVRKKWGKLTDDDVDVIAGKRDILLGKIQERHGIAREEAEKELKAWEDSLK
jgi:uncharacterized protein YjbJ (UPF0337 family)